MAIPQTNRSSTRRLTILYVASLSTVAGLLLSGHMLVQRMLKQQEHNLQIVSALTRQQMLCQRMGKAVQSLRLASNPAERQEQLTELQQASQEWKVYGRNVQQGMADLDKLGLVDGELRQRLSQLQPVGENLTAALQELVSQEQQSPKLLRQVNPRAGIKVMSLGKIFVQGTDNLLNYYNDRARLSVIQLQRVEMGLLGLSLVVLLLEGCLIFRPAVRKIQNTLEDLEGEQQKSEKLLLNILPEPIAHRLKQEEGTIADGFAEATVLFADIVGFTQLAARLSPHELVAMLNQIFSQFDRLLEKHGLEKIKTIGDAYMVVGGLPQPNPDHAAAIAEMALDMQQVIAEFNQATGESFSMRIGINTGPVVAGVIGLKKFIYDLWGDTVNIASRMESHGIPGEIQVTEMTYEHLKTRYQFKPRGMIAVKGRGDLMAYLLTGRHP